MPRLDEDEFQIVAKLSACQISGTPEDEKLRQCQCATNANQDPVLKPRLHVRFFACDGDAIFSVSRNEFNSNKFHS